MDAGKPSEFICEAFPYKGKGNSRQPKLVDQKTMSMDFSISLRWGEMTLFQDGRKIVTPTKQTIEDQSNR